MRTFRVIDVLGDCHGLYSLDHFVYNNERNEGPLAWFDCVAKPISDFNIQLGGIEDTMNQVFKLNALML